VIDESVLEELLAQIADEIEIPPDATENVLDALAVATKPRGETRSRLAKPMLSAAAAIIVLGLVIVPLMHSSSTNTSSKSSAATRVDLAPRGGRVTHGAADTPAGFGSGSVNGPEAFAAPGSAARSSKSSAGGSTPIPATGPISGGAPSAPADSAKIVKTGTLDLQVPHAALRAMVTRVIATAVGFGGYVAQSQTSYDGGAPTAQITIRVPVTAFETAIAHLDAMPGVTVLSDSENGTDVTGQYVDLQAQLAAATGERDALLVVLSHAQSIGDILAVRDRETAAQTEVDQLQGKINALSDQASFSSLALTLSEKPVRPVKAVVHTPKPQTGLAKSWSDARSGFANAVEWLIARSGGALIVLLAALALLFGIRYLYPVVRRGLV
jgi:hypothetical protein